MSMQVYPPIIIANIIINEFLPYRGFELINSNNLSDDDIISDMEKIGFIRIDAINKKNPRGNRNKIVIVVLKSNDNTGLELKKVKKIIDSIDNEDITKLKTLDELFVIVNKDFFERKNFNDIVKELFNRQKGNADLEGESAFYTVCPYHNFAFSVAKCNLIYPHEIMTKEEVSELLSKERITMRDLPTILTNDVAIIWAGARIGQVVRILRKSESALESIYYRKVENAIH